MATVAETQLADQTAAWCRRAEGLGAAPPDWCACLDLVREGILLRRQWDRTDPEAAVRRELLAWLAAAQSVCHEQIAAGFREGEVCDPRLADRVLTRLAQDDAYLAELLEEGTHAPEAVAFAIECFRDDLHWLATQAAILDGHLGVDFLGRILLEQEALRREIDAWADRPDTVVPDEIRQAAARLRVTALTRRIEAIRSQHEVGTWEQWRRTWRSSSHLLMQAGMPAPTEVRPARAGQGERGEQLDPQAYRSLQEHRARAMQGWSETIAGVKADDRCEALRAAAEELGDAGGETLTFLEDLPLDQAARNLEILSEDLAWCMSQMLRHWDRRLRPAWRSLRGLRRRVEGELQERRLGARLEGIFGHRAVMWWERLILVLLLLFVVMLGVEIAVVEELPADSLEVQDTIVVLAWADLGICMVFLTDFLMRLALARRRWFYFWRNWITGLLPSIPFGFISLYAVHATAMAEAGEGFVLLRALRYLRLPRMARWLRIARPAVRMMRLIAFLIRASDRLMRQLAPLTNRNLVLFERAAIRADEPPYRTAMAAVRERFAYRAAEVTGALDHASRIQLVKTRMDDLAAMLSAPISGLVAPPADEESATAREIPLDAVVARLLSATPATISDRVGRRLARSVAQWCRVFDIFAVRGLPVIRDVVAAGRLASPYEATARVANRIGVLLKGVLDRMYWLADLYGTVTAPQLVDSIGEYMVKGSARPAKRLIMFGAAFLAIWYLSTLLPFEALEFLTRKLRKVIGTPLIILGALCLIPLFLGMWFRQIAGEATDFFTRVAEAQFLSATKRLKTRRARRQHAVLSRRVLEPEIALDGRPRGQVSSSPAPAWPSGETEEIHRAVEMLWQDYLDGAPFHSSDTKTTTQLLGNLTLASLCQTRLRLSRARKRQLERLDLANSRFSLRGPYLWFRFISRSLAQQTAKLVVDYNAHALPLDRLQSAEDEVVGRYVRWLLRRTGRTIDGLGLPAAVLRRIRDDRFRASAAAEASGLRAEGFQGNEFTALHFLSSDRGLESDVRRRYGDAVADLMHADRRRNIRRVFRTYPLHRLPREARTVNPLAFYQRHLAGGWILLFPLKLAWWGLRVGALCLRLLWRIVRDVLNPTMAESADEVHDDPYAVAERKIQRMRAPVYLECMRLRAAFDPEYLGVLLPGVSAGRGGESAPPFEEDLARIDAEPALFDEFRQMARQRRRQVLELRRWLKRFALQGTGPRGLRAAALAYTIDFRGMRGTLEATLRLERAFDEVCSPEAGGPPRRIRGLAPRALLTRVRFRRRVGRLFRQSAFQRFPPNDQRLCRRLLYVRRGQLLRDVRRLARRRGADPGIEARSLLESVARDPTTWTRQLVILRAVQTLSVLDLETYRELTAELGEYEEAGAVESEG